MSKKFVHYEDMPDQKILIQLNEVSKIYGFGDATTVALDGITLDINKGEFVAIMGPSGSGKSTLLYILGLLDKATHGSYRLDGVDVSRMRTNRQAKMRRNNIGIIFQSFNLLPRLTAIENVALPLAYKGMTLTKRLKLADLLMEQVGLKDREYYLPKNLSGGQAQRVAIARALINSPAIIIADEPTGNLDSAASKVVMELLSELHATGNTIIMVTHNPEMTRYATRVLYMYDGSVVHDEKSKVGEIPRLARMGGRPKPKSDEEEQLEGISELMKAIPDKPAPARKAKKTVKPAKKRRRTTRKTTRKASSTRRRRAS